MQIKYEAKEAARFLRTLRVATAVAVSSEDMRRGGARVAPSASFLALAAKTGDWRFPAEGVLSGDGLLLAKFAREADGSGALILQAQGAAGLTSYAGRAARVDIGDLWSGRGAFDRFGALRLPMESLDEAALARFEVELLDEAP